MASNSTGIGENPLPPPIPKVWEKNDDVDVHYIIRDKWKWDGFVVSDYDAWFFMSNQSDGYPSNHYVDTNIEAAAVGLAAGLDLML